MKLIEQYFDILHPAPLSRETGIEMLKRLETIARVCYKSEANITDTSYSRFIRERIVATGHHAMLEHETITVKFVCSRGTSHALVRHRLASFAQESTIYCNYSSDRFGHEVIFIKPEDMTKHTKAMKLFKLQLKRAERVYMKLKKDQVPTSIAREVLPNATKTELVVTANLREWRTILSLRTGKKEGIMTKKLMISLLNTFKLALPEVFDDIIPE